MDYDINTFLCVTLFSTFTTLAFAFSLATYIQSERARRQTTRRFRALEAEVIYLIEEILALAALTTRSLAHTRFRGPTHYEHLTPNPRQTPSPRFSNSPYSYTTHPTTLHPPHNNFDMTILHQTTLALSTFIHPPLSPHQTTQIIHAFASSLRTIHDPDPNAPGALNRAHIPRLATSFLTALTRATAPSEIAPDQVERIMKWLRSALREMCCEDSEDVDSMRVNRSSRAPSSVSSAGSARGGDIGVSLSGSTLVASESSEDGEAGRRLVGRHWRPARFEVGGLREDDG